jgi:exodeoxyribonuclease VII large subunit
MSQAFDDVQSKLRDAKLGSARATHELQTLMRVALQTAQRRADAVLHKISPAQLRAHLSDARVRFESVYAGCNAATTVQVEAARQRLGLAAAALDALSPLAVLQRGYAIAQDKDGRLLRDARSAAIGDPVRLRLAKGRLNCRIEGSEET